MKQRSQRQERVYQANRRLPEEGLVKLTWGNVSEIDWKLKIVEIKPSGVPYDELKTGRYGRVRFARKND